MNFDLEFLYQSLEYKPETGKFFWKERPREHFASSWAWKVSNSRRAGVEAGVVAKNGYVLIGLKGKRHYAHRLAWFYEKKVKPHSHIDHIDRNPVNNRISNLRCVDRSTNLRNQSLGVRNTSGCCGVYWCKVKRKWCARFKHGGKVRFVGYFEDLEDARSALHETRPGFGYTKDHGAPRRR